MLHRKKCIITFLFLSFACGGGAPIIERDAQGMCLRPSDGLYSGEVIHWNNDCDLKSPGQEMFVLKDAFKDAIINQDDCVVKTNAINSAGWRFSGSYTLYNAHEFEFDGIITLNDCSVNAKFHYTKL